MLRDRDLPREGTKYILSSKIKPPLIPVFSDYIGKNIGGLKSRFPEWCATKFEKSPIQGVKSIYWIFFSNFLALSGNLDFNPPTFSPI